MNTSEPTAQSPPEVVAAFTSAVMTTLQELTQFEAFSEPFSSTAASELQNMVVASVRLVRLVPGTMTVVFTQETASCLAARYLPSDTVLTEEIVDDVAGEIANVIAGQAKTILKGTPYHYTMSPPVVQRVAIFSRLSTIAAGTLAASIVFERGKLLLLIDLPPCSSQCLSR